MTRINKFFLLIVFTLINQHSFSQETATVNRNNISIPIKNNGVINDLLGAESQPSYVNFNGKRIINNAGFYLSGYANDSLWVNGSAQIDRSEDYIPGLYDIDQSDTTNRIYKVSIDDPPFGDNWKEWKNAVKLGAYYYDGDENGYYDPIDHNGNGIWEPNEDRPDLLYDETYFTVYKDSRPSNLRYIKNVDPIGIEIKQTLFVSGSVEELSNTIFIRYSINNTGLVSDTLKDVVFSIFTNPEIGYPYRDNLIGCDTSLQSGFSYNDGENEIWGSNSPSIFYTILQGPTKFTGNSKDSAKVNYGKLLGSKLILNTQNKKFASHRPNYRFFPSFIDDPTTNKFIQRNLMLGKLADGNDFDPCKQYWSEVVNDDCEKINPRFAFSGDPVNRIGWLFTGHIWQFQLTSTDLFDLIKDQPQDIIIAYTVGQGDDAISSITAARERVRFIFEEYNNNFPNSFIMPDYNEIYPKEFYLSQNYPNPFNPSTTIMFTVPINVKSETSNTKLVVYDILGREVTTLVNEVKAPGTYEITFDASQLASGVYFYRLTSGNFVQTKKMILLR